MNRLFPSLVFSSLLFLLTSCGPGGEPFVYTTAEVSEEGDVSILSRSALDADLANSTFYLTDEAGAAVASQFSDTDEDGEWDQLLLLTEELNKGLRVYPGSSDHVPASRTNIRMAERSDDGWREVSEKTRATDHIEKATPMLYQMEGPAWENDRVGFRLYFDMRNGTDIWGKKTTEMVLDSVGWEGDNYHAMDDWGMDVLKVGNSLGAGGVALLANDTVFRLGDTREEHFRILEEGPLRSSFVVEYRGWEVGDRILNADWAFTITAGTDAYEGAFTVNGLTGGEELMIGIVNLNSDTLYTAEKDGRFIAYTHGPQAEEGHVLGMGLSIDQGIYLGHGETPESDAPVTTTYFLRTALENDQTVPYRFTAGWAPGESAFEDRAAFFEAVR